MRHTSNRRRSESIRGVAFQRAAKASTEIFNKIDEENGVECPVCLTKIKVGSGGKLVRHAPGGSRVDLAHGRPACWGGGADSEPVVVPNPQPERYFVSNVAESEVSWQHRRMLALLYTGHAPVRMYSVERQRWDYDGGRWRYIPRSRIPAQDKGYVCCDGNEEGLTTAWCFPCNRDDLPGCWHLTAMLKHLREQTRLGIVWMKQGYGEAQIQIVRAAPTAPYNSEPERMFLWGNTHKPLRIEDRIRVIWPYDVQDAHGRDREVMVTGYGDGGLETRAHRIIDKVDRK